MAQNTYSNQNIEVEALFSDTNNVFFCTRANLRDNGHRTNFFEDENENENFSESQYNEGEDNEEIENPYENALNESSENPLIHGDPFREELEEMKSYGLPTSFGSKKYVNNYRYFSNKYVYEEENDSEENTNESDQSNYDPTYDEETSNSPDEGNDYDYVLTDKKEKQYSELHNKIESDFKDFWALHGDTIVLNSWVLKYKDYISPEYLEMFQSQLKILENLEPDKSAEEKRQSFENDEVILNESTNDPNIFVKLENNDQKICIEQKSGDQQQGSELENDQEHLLSSANDNQSYPGNFSGESAVEASMQADGIDDRKDPDNTPIDINEAYFETHPDFEIGDSCPPQDIVHPVELEKGQDEDRISEGCKSDYEDIDPVLLPIEDISLYDPDLEEVHKKISELHQQKIPNLFTCTVKNSDEENVEKDEEVEYNWDDLWEAHCAQEYTIHYKLFSESYFKRDEMRTDDGENTLLDALRCNFCGEYNCDLCITNDYKNSHGVSDTNLFNAFNSSRKEGKEYIWGDSALLILKDISLTLNDLSIPENIFSVDADVEDFGHTDKILQNDNSDNNEPPLEMPIKMKRQ